MPVPPAALLPPPVATPGRGAGALEGLVWAAEARRGRGKLQSKTDWVDELIGGLENGVKNPHGFPAPVLSTVGLGGGALPFYPRLGEANILPGLPPPGVSRTRGTGKGGRGAKSSARYPGLPLPHGALPNPIRPPPGSGAAQSAGWFPGLPLRRGLPRPPGLLPNPMRADKGAAQSSG